jgi:hypothetical protein
VIRQRLFNLILCIGTVLLLASCGDRQSRPHAAFSEWNQPPSVTLPLRIAPDLLVKRLRFGVMKTTPSGNEVFVPTNTLPGEEGVNYGWEAEVETTRPFLRWQERLTVPKPLSDWGDAEDDEDVLISRDGRTALSAGSEAVDGGKVQHLYWMLGAGDPPGRYEMEVAIEGHPVGQFVFVLERPVHEKPVLVRYPRRTGAMLGKRIGQNGGSFVWK